MASTIFRTSGDAEKSLKDNKFAYSEWSAEAQAFKSATTQRDQASDLKNFAKIATFLCDDQNFKARLKEVSAAVWAAYAGLDVHARNKFTTALGIVARGKHFNFQNRLPITTTPDQPIAVKLVGGDPQLGYMLRNKLFWKDSMDLRHGEHSHSLQWLAVAYNPDTQNIAHDMYAQSANYWAPSKGSSKGLRSLSMWQWLADCFPTDMNNLATEQFLNGETLECNSFRSPQLITDYLFKGNNGKPLDDHFVSSYLYHRYKNRKWITTESKYNPETFENEEKIKKYYTGTPSTHRSQSLAQRGWHNSPNPNPKVAQNRLLRDRTWAPAARTDDPNVDIDVTFHNLQGRLSFYYLD